MGKKGKKKKAKITGTPDVVKFKQTREFWLLKECVNIQESLPFVAVDQLDDLAFKKVARFLNMVGLLEEFLQVEAKKDFRFHYHHKYLAPTPQYFPCGFDVEVIRQARCVQERPTVMYNGRDYACSEELQKAAEMFLKAVDSYMTKIASEIEPRLKDDFATGLKRFKTELKEDIVEFDSEWTKFEHQFAKARHEILSQVFDPIDRLVSLELQLSQAEEKLNIEAKQRLENDLVGQIEEFLHTVHPETKTDPFPEDTVPLAEACIFYESKCAEEWLHLCKHLIKDYLELRIFIMRIPQDRLKPQHRENNHFMRLLKNFHESVIAAREALDFVAKLPMLKHAKTSDWMTRRLLEPDLKYIEKTAGLEMQSTQAF